MKAGNGNTNTGLTSRPHTHTQNRGGKDKIQTSLLSLRFTSRLSCVGMKTSKEKQTNLSSDWRTMHIFGQLLELNWKRQYVINKSFILKGSTHTFEQNKLDLKTFKAS